MLSWLAAVLLGYTRVSTRQMRQRSGATLPALTELTMRLLVIRAGELIRMRPAAKPRYWRFGRDLRRRHLLRSAIGSALRRTLRHRDVLMRIASVVAVLRDLDTYARLFAKRMRGGLTRLYAIIAAPAPASVILDAPALTPAFPDSS